MAPRPARPEPGAQFRLSETSYLKRSEIQSFCLTDTRPIRSSLARIRGRIGQACSPGSKLF